MKLLSKNKYFLMIIFTLINLTIFGQTPSVYYPEKTDWIDKDDSRYITGVKEKFKNQIEVFAWGEVFKSLAYDFLSSKVGWDDNLHIKQKFQNELDSLVNDYTVAVEWAGIEDKENVDKILQKFRSGRFQGDVSLGIIIYFSGTDNEIELIPEVVDEEQAIDLRYRAETINKLLNEFKKPVREMNLKAIAKAESRWKNYINNGFSQYPWESFINGYITSFDIQNPPGHQWVIFHHELGVELSTKKIKQMKAKEVLTIEMLGWIDYYGDYWENFWGFSGIVTLRDDVGIGIGGIIHFGPTFNLGLTWHDINDDDNFFNDNPFLMLSIDILSYMNLTIPKYDKQLNNLKSARSIVMLSK